MTFIALDEFSNAGNSTKTHHMNHDGAIHVHKSIEVQSDRIPTLLVNAFPDDVSGYNIQIITENFEFSPRSINMENVQNQGHVHIYINDEKIARAYGEWFHLDDHHIGDDMNILRVTLNSNDHSEWSINTNPIEVSTVLN